MNAARAQDENSTQSDEVVLVTGSRIVRRDLTAASPIMTIDSERLDQSSTISVESVLNQMPQFIPDQTQFNAQGAIQTSPTTALGIGTVNLRGVSSNRTLVLVDGRRAQPATAALVVDLNTIPSAAIQRIETITGGASAVYGADALAGVVNFVLRDDFEGISMDVQTGFTEAGDGEETRFSSLLGMNSGSGDANMLLGVEWYERDVSFQRNRDFYVDGWHDPSNTLTTFFPSMPNFAPGTNSPSQAAVDSVFPQFDPGTIDPNQNFYFNLDGTPFVRQNGQALGFDDSQLGRPYLGDGFYGLVRQGDNIQQVYMDGALSTPMERRSAFGKAHIDIDDNLRAFVQANFSRTEVETYSAGPPPAVNQWGGSIPNDGRTAIPNALQTLLDSRTTAGGPWQLNRGLDFLGQFGPTNASDVYQIMAGVEGSFENRDWTWEAYYSSGETTATNFYAGLPSVQRWLAVVELPEFGAGQTFATSGGYQVTCDTGLPIFEGTTATTSTDCLEAIVGRYKSQTELSQDILEFNLQGKLADMSSGELRFAAGVSTRENTFVYEPLNPQNSLFDYPLGLFPSNNTAGETNVDEFYGELLVPVADRLNLELGYRYSDYDSAADTVGTYKTLFDWSVTQAVRLRGGYQRANRAPNTAELFQADTVGFEFTFGTGDPCQTNTNASWGNVPGNPNRLEVQEICAGLIGNTSSTFGAPGSAAADGYLLGDPNAPFTGINGVESGNQNLQSEDAETWTLGAVFQGPGGLDGLTASIDIYSIEITDAIAAFDGQFIYNQCFNANGMSNPTYSVDDPGGFCSLINRNETTGAPGTVEEPYLNTGLIETAGIDVAVNWAMDLSTGGSFYVNSLVSYLDKFNTRTTPTDPVVEYKDTLAQGGQYDYRINSTVGYNFPGGSATVGLRWRYLPEIRDGAVISDPNTINFPADSYSNFDLIAGYTISDRYQLRGGIDNLFDGDPAIVGANPFDSNSNSTFPGYYDTLGRRMYVGVKMVF
jgi:outer membrane receptor protein involved in Fe transport